MKIASGLSLLCATAAFILAPTAMAVAGQRALMVFTGIFVWSLAALHFMSKMLPAGVLSGSAGGPQQSGSGESKYVDLEKQSVDYTKIQDLLR